MKKHFNKRNEMINKRLMESWGYGDTKLKEQEQVSPFPPEPNITYWLGADEVEEELNDIVNSEKPTPDILAFWRKNMTDNGDAFVEKIMDSNSNNFAALSDPAGDWNQVGEEEEEQEENIRNGIKQFLGLE